MIDSFASIDPISGEEIIGGHLGNAAPVLLGKKKIYNASEVSTRAENYNGETSLEDYLLANLKSDIKTCGASCDYVRINLYNIIIDDKGRVVYYEFHGIKGYCGGTVRRLSGETIIPKINKLLSNAPAQKPATLNGTNVVAWADIFMPDYKIVVRDDAVTYSRSSLHPGRRLHW
jgi:hypothetical protein